MNIRYFQDYLNNILKEALFIRKYLKNKKFNEFLEDELLFRGVCRSFEIIGEAVKKLPKELIEKYSEIEWSLMAKMRDVLIHFYYEANEKIIWDTAKKDIPKLIKQVNIIINSEKQQKQ